MPGREQNRDLWFQILKYYIIVLNAIIFVGLMLIVLVLLIAAVVSLFQGNIGIFFGMLLAAAIFGLFPLYFWKIPIQGAIKENGTYLIINGVVTIVFFLLNLGDYSGSVPSGDKNDTTKYVNDIVAGMSSPGTRYTNMVLTLVEVAACFILGCFIRRETA